MLRAVAFAIYHCGLNPRCAQERHNGTTPRIDAIVRLIRDCQWGIHDLSRTELSAEGLPRFNMPMELGLFLGAHRFGDPRQRDKNCLVLDVECNRYQRFLSDIAGQDVKSHAGDPDHAIGIIRDWLADSLPDPFARLPGGPAIVRRFTAFQVDLPRVCTKLHLTPDSLTFGDYCRVVQYWLTEAEAVDPPPVAA
jgi:hypothetical protein